MGAWPNTNLCNFMVGNIECGIKTEGIGYYKCFDHKNLKCACGKEAVGSCGRPTPDGPCPEPLCDGKHCYHRTCHNIEKHLERRENSHSAY